MSMEWRNGQLMDDEEIEEKYWQFCEREPKKSKPPMVIRYDIVMGLGLIGLGIGAFWALVWMFIK